MPKYTEELVDEFIGHIVHGDTDKLACQKVGIAQETLRRWLKDDANHVHLCTAYERAKATRKSVLLLDIANSEDWRAKAWYVEKVYGHERPTTQVTINNTVAGAARVTRERMEYPDDYDGSKYGIQG